MAGSAAVYSEPTYIPFPENLANIMAEMFMWVPSCQQMLLIERQNTDSVFVIDSMHTRNKIPDVRAMQWEEEKCSMNVHTKSNQLQTWLHGGNRALEIFGLKMKKLQGGERKHLQSWIKKFNINKG